MVEHMKMMQMLYLHIRSMLLYGQVTHRTNSSQLFWNGQFQKKKTNRVRRGGESEDILFFEKTPRIVLVFLCTSWKFQVKQNSTPGNLVKLCMLIPLKFQSQNQRPLEISHEFFLVFLEYSMLFLINSWKFCMLFLEYPWKFYILNNLSPCLDFFQSSPVSKTLC